MEDLTIGELNLASIRAEEAALRRYQAVHWLDYLLGPLGISSQPSEKDFISCLRNGLVLCKLMNIVQSGSVSKVIEKSAPSPSPLWETQQLPAYQYFENLRNFLAAARELKLPIFDASVFERDNLEKGSSTKVVDCILALKAYHEWKQMTGGNGVYKPPKSPVSVRSVSRIHVHAPRVVSQNCSRQLDMSGGGNSLIPMPSENDIRKLEDTLVKVLKEQLAERKENVDNNIAASYCGGNTDSGNSFSKILSSCLEEQIRKTFPGIKSSTLDYLRERSCTPVKSTFVPLTDLSNIKSRKCCSACLRKGSCNHWNLLKQQEKELSDIKLLLSSARQDVELLQSQLYKDIKQLEDQVLEMSNAALGYHNAVQENRNLYNMVQDIKGSIRVYCRIRPSCSPEVQNVIDFIGEDGSLVVVDPKHQGNRKQMFQFNHVFDSAATQDDVFRNIQPLVRSVMDGYNACIFAYGQSGSGKTHTMFCPPGGPFNGMGISYMALNDLFELSDQRKDVTKYEIQVQLVEIYDEQVRDLLAEDSGAKESEIQIHVTDNGLALPDATLLPVKSIVDVINMMKIGKQNRAVGFAASRSHCILSVHVCGEDASGSTIHSHLHLVDLAGSEWADKSEAMCDKSVSCLVGVITALAQKHSHIPYQNSKLTSILQNSLGGNAKTLMLAHLNPERDSFEETLSTLRFAQRVSSVELGAARANKDSVEVLALKAELGSLRKALGNKEVTFSPMKRSKDATRTPCKSPMQMAERTPTQSRRMSIENGYCGDKMGAKTPSEKASQLIETTPPRSRRLSIEKMEAKTPSDKPKQWTERTTPPRSRRLSIEKVGAKTPSEQPKQRIERTPPPRSRRLSIENGTTIPLAAKSINHEDKRAVKTPPIRSSNRRSSLEGPHNLQKEPGQIRLLEAVTPEVRCPKNHSQQKDARSPTKLHQLKENNASLINQSIQDAPPRSPPSGALRNSIMRIDTASMKAPPPSSQIPTTPESNTRNMIQRPSTNDSNILSEVYTPCSIQTKGSHARKSLRSIGKLIKGSDKRKQKQAEAATPQAKSPTSLASRPPPLRRKSLTGLPPAGGMPPSTCDYDGSEDRNRNAKTPPPQRQLSSSTSFIKRWF